MLYQSINFIPVSQDKQSEQTVAINDRGLAFGDGVFTTAKITKGKIEYFNLHMARLKRSCEQLAICPVDWRAVSNEMLNAAMHCKHGCLKVTITAGRGERGYSRPDALTPTIIINVSPLPKHYEDWQNNGIKLACSNIKLGINPVLAGIKHLNRLEQVLIRNELDQIDADEVLVFDINGKLVECNTANVFWHKNGQWFTPKLDSNGVEGIIRQRLLELLPCVKEVSIKETELTGMDAMFITNALLTLAPVERYLDTHLNMSLCKPILKQLNQDAIC